MDKKEALDFFDDLTNEASENGFYVYVYYKEELEEIRSAICEYYDKREQSEL